MIIDEFTKDDYSPIEFHDQINDRIKVNPMYFKLGFSPSPTIFGRLTVLRRLLQALDYLPAQYGFLIWDIYRPRAVQKKLFCWMREEIRKKFPQYTDEENYQEAKKFISPPSVIGEDYCPPHLSGGAIDLTLYDISTDLELEMGTLFDDCTERAHRDYFTVKTSTLPEEKKIQQNRQFLNIAVESAGFTSYQYEWWHFDIGNIFWSQTLKKSAVFGPLFGDDEWPKIMMEN